MISSTWSSSASLPGWAATDTEDERPPCVLRCGQLNLMYELTVPSEGRLKRRDACTKLDTQSLNGLTNLCRDSCLEELCPCSTWEDTTCSTLAETSRSWGDWDSRSGEMELLEQPWSDDTRSISTGGRTRFKCQFLIFNIRGYGPRQGVVVD